MHYSINPNEIKSEIEQLGHTIINIWNIKQYRTKLNFSMSFVEPKPSPNKRGIFNIEYIKQCKIKFEPHKHRGILSNAQTANDMGTTENYCHLKPMCGKCVGNHLTNKCHRKERSSDVRCVLCGRNHSANYKVYIVYKNLQKKTYTPLHPKIYTPPARNKQTLYTQPGVMCSNNKTKLIPPSNTKQEPCTNQFYQHHQQ
jgi:hypothetical protein